MDSRNWPRTLKNKTLFLFAGQFETFSFLELQYYDFDERYSMLIFLPDGNSTTDLANFIRDDFDAELITKAYYIQHATPIYVELPKMSFEFSMDLTEVSLELILVIT